MIAMMAMFIAFPAMAKAANPDDRVTEAQINEDATATVIIADPKIPLNGRKASSSMLAPILVGGVLFAQWPITYFLSKKRMTRQESL